MTRVTPQLRTVAARLIAYEAAQKQSSEARPPAGIQVGEKLRPHLVTLMGEGGFRALLSRSITLAKAEVLWLRPMILKPDGSLQAPEQDPDKLDPDDIIAGRVVLLAHLLGLLVAFIGANLTSRLIRQVWPKVPLNDLDLDERRQNEKTERGG